MLTKEECINALENIIFNVGVARSDYRKSGKAREDYYTLNSLIEEHFSNPPLKFEELKEGMWVWDNKMVLYISISKIIGKTIYAEDFIYGFDCYGRYEKNRFYRKQVKE